MKKIVAAFDGLQYSESTRDYAISFTQTSDAHLVGLFMDDSSYTSYKIYELVEKGDVSQEKLKKLDAGDKNKRLAATQDFTESCSKAGLEFSIRHDKRIAINELKHESIYADMLIVDSKETLTHYSEKPPTRFIRDLLTDAQCPVMVVPAKYKPVKKVILLYDGEPSSVHAIKMFSYLLPSLKQLETEVISVNPVNSSLHIKDNKLIREFMKRHFPQASFKVMKGLAENEIVSHLKEQKIHTLVVLGAYRRGAVSRWFRESMADILMKELKFPLFVAHNK